MTKREKLLKKASNIRRNNIPKRDTAKGVVLTARIATRMIKYYNSEYGTAG